MKQKTRIPAAPYICFSSQVSSSVTYLILGSTPTLSSQRGLSALVQWPVRRRQEQDSSSSPYALPFRETWDHPRDHGAIAPALPTLPLLDIDLC